MVFTETTILVISIGVIVTIGLIAFFGILDLRRRRRRNMREL